MMTKIAKSLTLLIVPFILVAFTIKLHNHSGPYQFRSIDPEYIYLISAVTMGSGKLNVGHIDNPGTPIQLIMALSTRIQHLITGGNDYVKDVLANPDNYIIGSAYVFLVLIALTLIICSFLVYRKTNNLLLGILLQLSPFLYHHVMIDFSRLMPDSLMIIPVSVFITYCILFIYTNKATTLRHILFFSIISGFGLAFKLNFIAFWIIPFIAIKEWKNKAIYFGGAIISFLVLAFPLLFNLRFLFKWIKKLFLYTGSYGMGEPKIVDFKSFTENLNNIVSNYWFIYIIVLLSIISLIMLYFKDKSVTKNKVYRLLIGTIVCVIFHTLLVSKHFAFRYMYNVLYLTLFILFLNYESIFTNFKIKKGYQVYFYIAGIILSFFFVNDYRIQLNKMVQWKEAVYQQKEAEHNEITNIVKNEPFVIITNGLNYMFKERGIIFGGSFAGIHKDFLQKSLLEINPHIYLSEPKHGIFFNWLIKIPESEMSERYDNFYLFVGKAQLDKKDVFLSKLGVDYELQEILSFEKSGNKLFLVTLNM